MNPKLLEVIACPRCLARLQYDDENQQLICRYEHLAYPIENGVPILVGEKSEKIAD
ncbi:Trm112 family protein [Rodentibacter genomosp. 2]|uniref:Trm112 family protein n=1 Tax=Rodentibacter genomosp. 2 TaxID=1908266 RepID=UPI001ABF6AAE